MRSIKAQRYTEAEDCFKLEGVEKVREIVFDCRRALQRSLSAAAP
jgi:hypothetical protein